MPLDSQDARLWDRAMNTEAEGLLTSAARAGRFGRDQCEAAIQSVHIQRLVTGRANHAALLVLYDLLVTHSDSIGARIGRAVVLAEAGDPASGLAALDALAPARVARHQPCWVARSFILERSRERIGALAALNTAVELTEDTAVLAYLSQKIGLLQDGSDAFTLSRPAPHQSG